MPRAIVIAMADEKRCGWTGVDPLMIRYHDEEWGRPVHEDRKHFEFLVLEGAQAGLSWSTILRKREGYRVAFAGFDPEKVVRFSAGTITSLLLDPGIIRNRLKVGAAIENARRLKKIGSFAAWLDAHHPLSKDEWVKLFKKTFVFTGGEITSSFLMSVGYLPGAHVERCPVYARVLKAKPRWLSPRA